MAPQKSTATFSLTLSAFRSLAFPMAPERDLRIQIGLLISNAPITQVLEADWFARHRTAHKCAVFYYLKFAVEISNLRLLAKSESTFHPIHARVTASKKPALFALIAGSRGRALACSRGASAAGRNRRIASFSASGKCTNVAVGEFDVKGCGAFKHRGAVNNIPPASYKCEAALKNALVAKALQNLRERTHFEGFALHGICRCLGKPQRGHLQALAMSAHRARKQARVQAQGAVRKTVALFPEILRIGSH